MKAGTILTLTSLAAEPLGRLPRYPHKPCSDLDMDQHDPFSCFSPVNLIYSQIR